MIDKEVRELRRRFRSDKENFRSVHGCYVNENRAIISTFEQPLLGVAQEESERYLNLLKKSLSGTLGKNLVDINFSNQQVLDSDEHRLLSMLRSTGLKDDALLSAFFQRVIETISIEGNYLILIAHDVYSVPYRGKDEEMQQDAADEEFSYIVCSVCPVKLSPQELSYDSAESRFRPSQQGWNVSAPEIGFLFPAFDDRAANLYSALYYTRNTADNHPEFIDAIFHTEAPMPAAAQKETFQELLSEALHEECRLDVVQSVHGQISTMIADHKEVKDAEPLALTGREIGSVLRVSGVSSEKITAFSSQFDAHFGEDAALAPANVVDARHFELRTPDVVIKVNPERSDLVETRVIDGMKYILICADEGVEVNGVSITISKEE